MNIKSYLLVLLCLSTGLGCASKNKLVEKYPLSEISRPYTLPNNVDSWSVLAFPFESTFLVNPLYWEMSFSDTFSLVWAPLPLGLKWQILNTENHRLGVSAIYVVLGGLANLNYRYKTAGSWALDLDYNYTSFDVYLLKLDMSTGSIGPLYQFTDRIAGKIYISTFTGRVSSGLVSDIIDTAFGGVRSNSSLDFSGTGGGLDLFYSFNHQWNMKAGVSAMNVKGIGSITPAANLSLTHLWD